MRLVVSVLPLLIFASHASPAVDSVLFSLIPSAATLLTGIDVSRAATTVSGQYILKQTTAEQSFVTLINLTGTDVSRDVRQLLLVGIGRRTSFDAPDLTLLDGNFDMSRIAGKARSRGASVTQYRGSKMLMPSAGDTAIASPRPGVLMVGKVATVKMALDSAGTAIDPGLEQQVMEVGQSDDVWFATIMSGSSLAQQVGDTLPEQVRNSDALQSILRSCGGLRFGPSDEASIVLATRSDGDAQLLSALLRFAGGFARVPVGRGAATALAQAALSSMQVSEDGSVVHATSAISDAELAAALASGS